MLEVGKSVDNIQLPNIDGQSFSLETLRGKRVLVAFHRFATCPFCNLRIHQLVKQFDQFGEDFMIVAIFDSPLDHLQQHSKDHHAPFYILADQTNHYYQAFQVERSLFKVLKGFVKHLPQVLYAMFVKGYWPFPIKGNVLSLPLEILLDEKGQVQFVHRGQDEGDHVSIETLKRFALTGKL